MRRSVSLASPLWCVRLPSSELGVGVSPPLQALARRTSMRPSLQASQLCWHGAEAVAPLLLEGPHSRHPQPKGPPERVDSCPAAMRHRHLRVSIFLGLLTPVRGRQTFCDCDGPDGTRAVSHGRLKHCSARFAEGNDLSPRQARLRNPDEAMRSSRQSDITTGRVSPRCSAPWIFLCPKRAAKVRVPSLPTLTVKTRRGPRSHSNKISPSVSAAISGTGMLLGRSPRNWFA